MNFKLFKRKERPKETFVEFLTMILSCWFIAVGTSLIVDAQFSFQIGIKSILWQTLFAIVAAVLVTRKWWIPIIYFGILLPVFFLAIVFSGDFNNFFESLGSFVDWWINGMSYNSEWYTDEGFYLVHTFINVGISVLYFAVARIFKKSIFVVGVVVAFIVANYSLGSTGFNLLAIPFLVVGVFPFIAGEKFQKVKLPDFKNLFGVWGKKWMMVIIATVVAVAISVLSVALANSTDGSVRNRVCSDIVADLQTLSNTYLKEQKKVNITLFDLGLVMNSTYVGGNLYNIEPRPLAATSLTKPTLVKMTSFETYDGVMWENDFEKSYRINGYWDYEQSVFLAGEAVGRQDFLGRAGKLVSKKTVKINLAQEASFVPTVGQVIGFEENTKTKNPVLYDKHGRIFSYYGFEEGYSYTMDVLSYDTNDKTTAKKIDKIYKLFDFEKDSLYDKNSEFYKCYTQLPSNLPKELIKVLGRLDLKGKNEYEKAEEIANYFSYQNGYVYDYEPNNFVRGDDIIEQLFKTKKGHCVYYATAMAVMARKAGIPTRFVAGYKTVKNPDGKKQIIDASSPYAWVECYIPNIGWISFDPAPDVSVIPNAPNSEQSSSGQQSSVQDVQIESEVQEEEKHVAGTNLKWKENYNTPVIVLIALLALALICFIINALIAPRCYQITAVRKRFRSTKAQTEFYYRDILRQFLWLGFDFKRGETISELTQRACADLPFEYAQAVLEAMRTVEEMHYGNITPSDEAVTGLYNARTQLEKILNDRNNKVMYILKRRLLLPAFNTAGNRYK